MGGIASPVSLGVICVSLRCHRWDLIVHTRQRFRPVMAVGGFGGGSKWNIPHPRIQLSQGNRLNPLELGETDHIQVLGQFLIPPIDDDPTGLVSKPVECLVQAIELEQEQPTLDE